MIFFGWLVFCLMLFFYGVIVFGGFGCCEVLIFRAGAVLIFSGCFGILSSFASLYRFNFASFYIFCWLVYSSARLLFVAYFYFFKGS